MPITRFLKAVLRLVLSQGVIAVLSPLFALPLWALWPFGAQCIGASGHSYPEFVALVATAAELFFAICFGGWALLFMAQYLREALTEEPETSMAHAMRKAWKKVFGW